MKIAEQIMDEDAPNSFAASSTPESPKSAAKINFPPPK